MTQAMLQVLKERDALRADVQRLTRALAMRCGCETCLMAATPCPADRSDAHAAVHEPKKRDEDDPGNLVKCHRGHWHVRTGPKPCHCLGPMDACVGQARLADGYYCVLEPTQGSPRDKASSSPDALASKPAADTARTTPRQGADETGRRGEVPSPHSPREDAIAGAGAPPTSARGGP